MVWHPLYTFTDDAGYVPPVVVDPPVVVGGGLPRKPLRTVTLRGKSYIGTEEEIESLIVELLEDESDEPVEVPKKSKKKQAPIEIEVEEKEVPESINIPVYKALLKEAYREQDAWLTYTLKEILRRYEEEEDDIEIILWSLH